MNDNFENQKEKLVSIKHEISLLYQQVNYLIRNEKDLGLLDLDVLMNRTHAIYDLLCSVSLGEEAVDEDLPFDAEALSGLFGGMTQEEPEAEPVDEAESEVEAPQPVEETPVEAPEEAPVEPVAEVVAEPVVETPVEPVVEAPAEPVAETPAERVVETLVEPVIETPVEPVEEAPDVEETPAIETIAEEKPLGDEFGFFFRFEDIPQQETEAPASEPEPVKTDGKVVNVMEEVPLEEIPERDRVSGDDLVKDNPLEMPKVEDELFGSELFVSEKPAAESVSDFFDNDDTGFELSAPETLGDRMMQEDNSLAAKLQQNPVQDLKAAIGINDKFLFVNELFGGSMEKYNKSIENLSDLKTLNGAMIYLNELKIELQWNSSNEAYQKLKELVSRRFE